MSGRPRCLLRRTGRDERGSVAVEAALVLPILIIVLFGIVEMSLMVRDKIAITAATRVGARAASTTAAVMSGPGDCQYRDSDAPLCTTLNSPAPGLAELAADAIQSSGSSMSKDLIDYILVYQANDKGYPGANGQTTMPASCSGYANCVKFRWVDGAGTDAAGRFRYVNGSWASKSVNACAGQADSVGVYLHITHRFFTGLFADSVGMDDRAVARFEPLPPDNCKSTSPFPHP